MPVHESEAIILRTFPLGEGDRLVSFLGRAEGRLRGVASGARKPKSRFGSTLELLSYVQISFYQRETRDLVRIKSCELIESFLDVQRDYAAGIVLALASEITEAVLGEREAAEAHFRLLLVLARGVKHGIDAALAMAYFALWTVRLGGWLPQLDKCARCGAVLSETAYFGEHGIFCGACRIPGQRPIAKEVLEIARRMLANNLENVAKGSVSQAAVLILRHVMLDLIEQRIEKRLRTRKPLDEGAGALP
jgi:DNA repair protein RecO (recombination protein O)